jgi:DNA-binding ferritin-like protein (Dps family)
MYRSLMLVFRFLVGLIAAGFLLIPPDVSPAHAQQPPTQQTSPVNQFLSDPSALLKANPNGGGRLVSAIRDLLLSSSCASACQQQVLNSIIGLLANANVAQKTAIGTALADVAQALVTTNPTFANAIQTAVAQSGVQEAIAAYQTTVGNLPIGAAGGGGGPGAAAYQTLTTTGGGGGGGGATGGGGGGGAAGFGLTGGGSVSGGGTTTTTTTAFVSPI